MITIINGLQLMILRLYSHTSLTVRTNYVGVLIHNANIAIKAFAFGTLLETAHKTNADGLTV